MTKHCFWIQERDGKNKNKNKKRYIPAHSILTLIAAEWRPLPLGLLAAETVAAHLAGLVTAVPYRLQRPPSLARKRRLQNGGAGKRKETKKEEREKKTRAESRCASAVHVVLSICSRKR